MESLYAKLHDKYNKLKNKKDDEMEHIHRDQETNFINYVSAAEELMEILVNECEKLRAENVELRNELSFVRSAMDEQRAVNQRLLMEDGQRRRSDERSRAIEKIKPTQHDDNSGVDGDIMDHDINPHQTEIYADFRSGCSGRVVTKKLFESGKQQRKESFGDRRSVAKKPTDTNMEVVSTDDDRRSAPDPCCVMTVEEAAAAGDSCCMYQALVECLIGMKVSAVDGGGQGGAVSTIQAVHQSSGYTFRLRWVGARRGGERENGELMYKVMSLGTFERVAPDWMRDVLLFGFSMCPLFFHRLSRVIRLHH